MGACMKRLLGIAVAGALVASSAVAADLAVKAPTASVVPAAYSWTGFYVGANVGYGAGERESSTLTLVSPAAFDVFTQGFTLAPSGWVGGAQAGYNWQSGRWVLGVEGDFQWTGQRDSFCGFFQCAPALDTTTINQRIPWFATARARVGVAAESTLFYVTGGGAWAKVRTDILENCPAGCSPDLVTAQTAGGSFSDTKAGWVIGAGIEAAVSANWTVKAEFLHLGLGTVTRSIGVAGGAEPFTTTFQSRIRNDVVRVGVNYRL